MKKQSVFSTVICLVLLVVLMAAGTFGVNSFTAPIVAENERLAAEAAAEAEKALLGDSELLYDRADPAASALTVTADTVPFSSIACSEEESFLSQTSDEFSPSGSMV